MATKKEIELHLSAALEEIGEIRPWFEEDVDAWVFSHKNYPEVEYADTSKEDVIKHYPEYLREFIRHRLNDNITERAEKKTKGRK